MLQPTTVDYRGMSNVLNQLESSVQGVFAVIQAQINVDSTHTQRVDLAIQFGEQATRSLCITIGANALNTDLFPAEGDDDLFITGGAPQADANGSFYDRTP
jgi:hypothetical protein